MKITQLRNATIVIHYEDKVILVDPMLAPQGAIPALKYFTKNKRRNPLVELPKESDEVLNQVTHCLITHCQKGHFDHLDRAGAKWLRDNKIPVFCAESDADYLQKKGLDVHPLNAKKENTFFDGSIKLIPCLHGRGLIGKLMEHGYGYVIHQPNEPSLYLAGDTVLSPEVKSCISDDQPEVIVIPAGGAQFDLGGDLIMGLEEAIKIGELSTGKIIANHLEALDHCPTSRDELTHEVGNRSWQDRYFIPADGETIALATASI